MSPRVMATSKSLTVSCTQEEAEKPVRKVTAANFEVMNSSIFTLPLRAAVVAQWLSAPVIIRILWVQITPGAGLFSSFIFSYFPSPVECS